MHTNKVLGSALIISSTSIGAAMIALPVSLAGLSFAPSCLLLVMCWFLMLYSSLLILEANLWFEPGANMVTMAEKTLGSSGRFIAWSAYLLLLYALMTAYLSGMSAMVEHTFNFTHGSLTTPILMTLLLALILYLGTKTLDLVNRVLIFGLLLSYMILVGSIAPHISQNNLTNMSFHHFLSAIPIIVTAFGFHIVIPSIRQYIASPKKIVLAITLGTLIPLVLYLGWNFMILGSIPETQLVAIWFNGQPAVDLPRVLNLMLENHLISSIASLLTFFAIATSFIGVAMSLFDFLCDGLPHLLHRLGRPMIAAITFIPPIVMDLFYPNLFLATLGYASIFVAILLGLLPVAMVWHGRYYQKMHEQYRAPGEKVALSLAALLFLGIILIELTPK